MLLVVVMVVMVVAVHLMRLFSPRTWKNSPESERDTDLIFSFTMSVTPDIRECSLTMLVTPDILK